MVEISLSGSGEGSGWVTAPGYSTTAIRCRRRSTEWSPVELGLLIAATGGSGVGVDLL